MSDLARAVVLTVLLGSAAYAQISPAPRTPIDQALGLKSSRVVPLRNLPTEVIDTLEVPLRIDGRLVTLSLAPHSVRSRDFKLWEQTADGSLRQVTPPPSRTLRGRILEIAGSTAAGSLRDGGLVAAIRLPGEGTYWLEPIIQHVDGANAADHVLYDSTAVSTPPHSCVVKEVLPIPTPSKRRIAGQDPCPGAGFNAAEIALDTDYEYFLDYGTVPLTTMQMEDVINATNLQYEAQLEVTHVISNVIVRTTSNDPYTTSDPDGMLCEYRNHWNANHSDIHRDIAQLFTGKVMNGPPIGIAWRGTVCNVVAIDPGCVGGGANLAYSVVESNYNGTNGPMACKADLSAHELGHAWNANHCACTQFTMNASITSCNNDFHETFTLPVLTAFRNSRTCLEFSDAEVELIRLLITAEDDSVEEGGILNMDILADLPEPPCVTDIDVANEVEWVVTPQSAGSVDSFARFFANEVTEDTEVELTAIYDGEYGEDQETIFITIEDIPSDERVVEITLLADADVTALVAGQSFNIDVLVGAPLGDIEHVRLLQFDTLLSLGATVDDWVWNFDELIADSLYGLFLTNGTVRSAVYSTDSPVDGFVVNLSATPQRVATMTVTANETGSLSVLGLSLPPTTDLSARFIAGFTDPIEFSQAEANVDGGTIALTVTDEVPLEILSSIPHNEAIDARQPHPINGGSAAGWDTMTLTFNGAVAALVADDFLLNQDGGDLPAPGISQLTIVDETTVDLHLDDPVRAGAWTTFTFAPTGSEIRVGYLPGDVDADATSGPLDILALIDHLNGVSEPLPAWSTDINRTDLTDPQDILRVIDLLNGADAFDPWNGVSLP
jgi:hypothetical protein